MKGLIASGRLFAARVQKWRAVRVFQLYSRKNGAILAGGLSLTALYSVFAGLYVGFALLGMFLARGTAAARQIIAAISEALPGLIGTGRSSSGAIDLDALFASHVLGWSSIVALAALLVTALGWFASARSAIRSMFDLPPDSTLFILLKLKDLMLAVGAAAVIIVTAGLSVVSTSALEAVFALAGIDAESDVARYSARVIGLVIVLAIDTAVLAVLIRVMVAVPVPPRRMLTGMLLGGIGLTVLQVLGGSVVGGTNKNPLLASFAVILGLLVYFGFVCQVILIAATWVSVDLADHGHALKDIPKSRVIAAPPEHRRPKARAVSPPR